MGGGRTTQAAPHSLSGCHPSLELLWGIFCPGLRQSRTCSRMRRYGNVARMSAPTWYVYTYVYVCVWYAARVCVYARCQEEARGTVNICNIPHNAAVVLVNYAIAYACKMLIFLLSRSIISVVTRNSSLYLTNYDNSSRLIIHTIVKWGSYNEPRALKLT